MTYTAVFTALDDDPSYCFTRTRSDRIRQHGGYMPKIAHHGLAEMDGRARVPVSVRVIRDERYIPEVHTLKLHGQRLGVLGPR